MCVFQGVSILYLYISLAFFCLSLAHANWESRGLSVCATEGRRRRTELCQENVAAEKPKTTAGAKLGKPVIPLMVPMCASETTLQRAAQARVQVGYSYSRTLWVKTPLALSFSNWKIGGGVYVRQRERRRCQQLAPLSFLRLTSLSDERVITHLQLKMSALLAFSLAPLYFSIARSLSFSCCLSFSPIYEVPTFCLRFFLVFFLNNFSPLSSHSISCYLLFWRFLPSSVCSISFPTRSVSHSMLFWVSFMSLFFSAVASRCFSFLIYLQGHGPWVKVIAMGRWEFISLSSRNFSVL